MQALTNDEVGHLLLPELADSPDQLVSMRGDVLPESRRQVAERFPSARIVDYPNMPD